MTKTREELLDDLARCFMEIVLRKALAEHGIDLDGGAEAVDSNDSAVDRQPATPLDGTG